MKAIQKLQRDVAKLQEDEPKLRSRDLAHRLGISEAELTALSVGKNVTMLEGDWKALLQQVHTMGYVMALTRNDYCVHERKGVYDNITFMEGNSNMGLALNEDIDLRFFMSEWHYGMAVEMQRGNTSLHSLQFFNNKGEAVHKIFSTPKSNVEAYHTIVSTFKAKEQVPLTDVDRTPYPEKIEKLDEEIDITGFQDTWKNLQDTHDFFPMLKKYNVARTQGFRLAPKGMTRQVDNQAVVRVLQTVADRGVSIMCFLHSKGVVQIHTGEIKNLKFFNEWYNIMDPKFNLHLNMSGVAETWIVKKPTVDGIVTSLELFDEKGDLITYFFGARKPGKPELEEWRAIIEEV